MKLMLFGDTVIDVDDVLFAMPCHNKDCLMVGFKSGNVTIRLTVMASEQFLDFVRAVELGRQVILENAQS